MMIEFNVNKNYFEDYLQYGDGIAEDLARFANATMIPAQNKEQCEAFRELMKLPIHRGFFDFGDKKVYTDNYLFEGRIYNEKELTELLDTKPITFLVEVEKTKAIEDKNGTVQEETYTDQEPFDLGVWGLFYYKNGPEAKGSGYEEFAEEESSLDGDIDR